MSTINIFQISFEMWGCLISIAVCIMLGTITIREKDAVGKKLWAMLLVNNFILIADALAFIFRGDMTPVGLALTRISNFVVFAVEYILLLLFTLYVKDITGNGCAHSSHWWEYLVYAFEAVAFTGLVVTQFTGLYYSFDEMNYYHRSNGLWISFVSCGAILIICFARLYHHRSSFSRYMLSTFFLCIIIVFICLIIQFIVYGLSLINSGLTVVLLLIYARHFKIQYDLYIRDSIEKAVRDTEEYCAWKQQQRLVNSQEVHGVESKK